MTHAIALRRRSLITFPALAPGLALAAALLAPLPASAHPHQFVDTAFSFVVDELGRVTSVRVGWTYDELTSLLILEAFGLDKDGDGNLTEEEVAALQGFDMEWEPEFEGDSYALQGDQPLVLGRPEAFSASYANGKLRSSHLRRFDQAVTTSPDLPLMVQSYDPEYYTAYLVEDASVEGGAACEVQIFTPDLSQADIALQAALELYGPNEDPEAAYPLVGAAYAEEARITCSAP